MHNNIPVLRMTAKPMLIGLALVVGMLGLIIFIKYDAVFSNMLILDDCFYYSNSIYSNLRDKGIYWYTYTALNEFGGAPGRVRIFYILIYCLSAFLLYSLLVIWGVPFLRSAFVSLLAFVNPTTAIIPIFINGSYNVISLSAFLLGVVALSLMLTRLKNLTALVAWFLSIMGIGFLILSMRFTTNGVLLPLAVCALPWWATDAFKLHKKKVIIALLFAVVVLIVAAALKILDIMQHPYAKMEGRLVYEVGHMALYGLYMVSGIIASTWSHPVNTGFHFSQQASPLFILTAATLSVSFISLVVFTVVRRQKQSSFSARSGYIELQLLPFFGALLVLSLVPLSPNVLVHQWHYYLPGIFTFTIIGLAISFIIISFKWFALCLFGILVFHCLSLSKAASSFNSYAAKMNCLENYLQKQSQSWSRNASVIVLSDNVPPIGLTSKTLELARGTGYMRVVFQRPDLRSGLIVPRSKLQELLANNLQLNTDTVYIYRFDFSKSKGSVLVNGMSPRALWNEVLYLMPGFTQLSDTKYLYRHDPEAKQRLWIHRMERDTLQGETLKASLKVASTKKMSLSASLARHDTNEPYEGTARLIVLEPGVETLIEVPHTFQQPRKNLKIQLDIKECDRDTAEITIRDIQISKSE